MCSILIVWMGKLRLFKRRMKQSGNQWQNERSSLGLMVLDLLWGVCVRESERERECVFVWGGI